MKKSAFVFICLLSTTTVFSQISDNGDKVGIGTETPEVKLHVQQSNVGVKSDYATQIIENIDAQLDITSDASGTWGSAINLIEGNDSSSNNNIWSIVRQTSSNGDLSLRFNYGTLNRHTNPSIMTLSPNGNVGIGTSTPATKFEIYDNTSKFITFRREGVTKKSHIGYGADHEGGLYFGSDDNQYILWIQQNGLVGIGTTNPDPNFKLSVNGKIRAKEIRVETNWSDFVFEDDYNLTNINELEYFILKNKHLPDMPSAKEVEENGVNLGEINSKLLQKIEELTLYIIEQDKRIKNLEIKLDQSENE